MQEGNFLEVCDGGGHLVQAVMGAVGNTKSASVLLSSDVQKASILLKKTVFASLLGPCGRKSAGTGTGFE